MIRVMRCAFPSLALLGAIGAMAVAAVPAAAGDPLPTAAFAIGDLSASLNAPVTFWGAQWRKDNQVSSGVAPPSFTGYAVDVDPTACTFTTAPGNSAPPRPGRCRP